MPIVNIPNVGQVNFPDSMSQDAILAAIQNDILPTQKISAQPEPQGQVTVSAAPTEEPESTGITGAISDINRAVTDVLTPSQASLGAVEKGFVGVKQAATANQIASLMELQAADKRKYGEFYEKAPASELEAISARDKAIQDKIQQIAGYGEERAAIEQKRGINPLQKEIRAMGSSPEYEKLDTFDKLKAYGSTLLNNKSEIPGYIAGIGLESAPSSLVMAVPAILASFFKLGPTTAAASAGATSAMMEFGNTYAEYRAQGMPHDEAWEKAGVKSGAIGLFDAASFGSAGNAARTVLKDVERGVAKDVAKQVGKEVGVQALYGMAGETIGSLAASQNLDPIAIMEEGLGEIFGAPAGAVSTFKSAQKEAIAARQPTPTPPPGPVVQSAEGTPIPAMPLDTAIKQTAAQASAPNIEAQVQAKATELGIPLADAQKLVLEETQNGTQQSNGVVPGANQPSVSVPQDGLQPTGGVTTSQPTGLASPVGATGQPGVRTEAVQTNEPSALNDRIQASAQVMGVLQQAQEGYKIAQQEYEQTGKSPTMKKVRSYILQHFTPAIGKKKANEFADYLLEEGNLNSSDLGTLHPAFDETVSKVVIPKVTTQPTPTTAAPAPIKATPVTPGLQSLDSSESQKVQNDTGTMAHTLFNTNNVRTDGRPGFDQPPAERWPLINAFEMGGRDARNGYSKGAKDYKNKQEKQAYELGLKYANGLMAGYPIDVSSEAASLLTTTPTETTTTTAPQATKGKRTGRPAAVLTPEEAVAKKQAKATQTKEWKATDKQIAAAKAVLELPEPSRDEFKTQDAYLDAGMRYRTDRNQALDTLHGVATGPQRSGKLGATAKVGLDHPSITPQERANIQVRADTKKRGIAKVSKSSQTTTSGVHNDKYLGFKTTQQAINHILANGTTFERFLARRLAPFLKDVQLQIVNAENELPELRTTDGTLKDSFQGANGVFGQWTRPTDGKTLKFIFLRGPAFGNAQDFQGTNNTVFLHEALHAATNARIDEYLQLLERGSKIPAALLDAIHGLEMAMFNAQDAFLEKKLSGEPVDPRLDDLFNRVGVFEDLKEFVAYGLTEDVMQQFLLETKGEAIPDQPGFFKTLFNAFTNSIRQLFAMDRNHQSALQDLILVTEGLLQYKPTIEVSGVSAARQKKDKVEKVDRDVKKVMLSQKIHEITEGLGGVIRDGHDFQDYKDYLNSKLKGMGQDAIQAMLYVLRTSDIIRWMGDKIPGLKEIDDFTQKMSAMRTSMLDAYAKKTDELAEWLVSGKGNDKLLGNSMHLGRLKGVTPDAHATAIDAVAADPKIKAIEAQINDPATDPVKLPSLKGQVTKRKNDIQVVYDAWERLGKVEGGHEMYKMVRQFYKDNYNLTRHLLDERIERLQELPGDVKDEKTPKGQLMAEIRKMQEKDAIQEYFPLMRHGAVWLREAGADKGFILFDTAAQRELYKIKKAREANKSVEQMFTDNEMSEGNDIASLRRTNHRESSMLKNMFEIVDKAKMDEISSEELKDQLYQTWLMTLPESSIRKQFLHAENVAGFSADVFRNFTESANRIASQIPRLKYADQMEAEITRARDSLSGNPEQAKLGLFIDAVSRRAVEQLNPPTPNILASLATRYAYYMLLTGAMSAAVQLVAVPVMIYPVMAARYGVGRASAKFAAYSNILNSMGYQAKMSPDHLPVVTISVADSTRVKNNKTLSKAYAELKERGLFAFTENNLLSQRGRTPLNATLNLPKKVLRTTANIMSGLFSGSERISREIASMMAFELHYEKTKNFDESINKAIAAVQDNMGRYDAMERPEAFKYAPVISQFKMYAANMTSFFIRHAYTSTQVMKNPKEAAESMKILGGVLMMGAMFHGLKGMPLYSTVGAVVEALSDLGEDDEEKRRRRAQNPLVYQNADLRFRRFLQENFGPVTADMLYSGPISSITDINIGSRTSFDNLWFRGGQPAKTNKEAFNNFILANIGPAVSGILGQAGALDDFENGHIERGLEKALPAFFKNPLVAARLATEGAKTKAGDTIIKKEDITIANILAQAAGSPPTKLARTQEVGFELKGEYIKANQDRTKILQHMNDAILNKEFNGDKKDLQPVINQIRQHNKKYIGMEKLMVDGEAIDNTLNAALDARALTYKGVRIPTEDMLAYFIPVLKQGQK